MIELNMNMPRGYRATGEFRKVLLGELYYDNKYSSVRRWVKSDKSTGEYLIADKEYSGEDLVGCLCGVSDYSLEDAETNAEYISDVTLILTYDEDAELYMGSDSRKYIYAYPVSAEDVKSFGNTHIEHLN
jgi:hypothetical protein